MSKARPGAIHKTAGSITNLPAGGMESISARGGVEVFTAPVVCGGWKRLARALHGPTSPRACLGEATSTGSAAILLFPAKPETKEAAGPGDPPPFPEEGGS